MQQNSEEWLAWRASGIGSSDAAVVLGESPYKTPYELWEERTGRSSGDNIGYAGYIGHRAEPYIRRLYEQITGDIYEPVVMVSEEYPFMLASLDGRTLQCDRLIECKLNDVEKHSMAKKGIVPIYHLIQMQHQLLVSGCEEAIYLSAPYTDHPDQLREKDLVVIVVLPDLEFQQELIIAEAQMVEHIATDTPPKNSNPVKEIHTKQWKRAAAKWKRCKKHYDDAKAELDAAKNVLVKLADEVSAKGEGLKLTKSWRRGSVDYKAVPELAGLNLDSYRGKGSFQYSIKETENAKSE